MKCRKATHAFRAAMLASLFAFPASADTIVTSFGAPRQLVLGDLAGLKFRSNGTSYVGPVGVAFERDTEANLAGNGTYTVNRTRLWLAPSADYFFTDRVSVGGVVSVASVSGSSEVPLNNSATQKFDLPTTTAFSLLGRVGYSFPLGERTALWGRAGLGYLTEQVAGSSSTPQLQTKETFSSFFLTLDASFLFRFSETFFVSAGPDLFVSLGGSHTESVGNAQVSGSAASFEFGIRSALGVVINL